MVSLKTHLKHTKNRIIQGTIQFKDNWSYFEPRINEVLAKRHTFSPHKIDSAFLQVCIEYQERPEIVLNKITDYILNGTKNIQNDAHTSEDLRELICDLLDESVESENADALRKIVEWYTVKIATMTKLQGLVKEWNNEYLSQFSGPKKALKVNNSAMIRACEKSNFDMVLSFLNHDWTIDDHYYKPCLYDHHDINLRFDPLEPSSRFPMFMGQNSYDNLEDTLENFKLFNATSTSAFLLAKFRNKIDSVGEQAHDHNSQGSCQFRDFNIQNEDPLSETFHNTHIAIIKQNQIIEYRKKFKEVEVRNKKFLVDMLDLCKNTDEAILLLSKDMKLDHYFGGKMPATDLPRLDVAVMNRHLEFVAHDYCQHVLRIRWLQSDVTGEIIQWGCSNIFDEILYVCKCVLLSPIYLLCFLPICMTGNYSCATTGQTHLESNDADNIELEDNKTRSLRSYGSVKNKPCLLKLFNRLCHHYSFPVNRFIATMMINVLYVCILVINVFNPLDVNPVDDTDWYNIAMVSVTLGYVVDDVIKLKDQVTFKGWRTFSAVNYDIIVHLLIIVGCFAKFFGFLFHCSGVNKEGSLFDMLSFCDVDAIVSLPVNSPVKIGYTVSGVAVTMAILKFLYWLQINSWIGPLVITIKRVAKDILLVGITYIVFLLAFTSGIYYILQLSLDMCKSEAEKYGLNHTNATSDEWKEILGKGEPSEYSFDIEEQENKFILWRTGIKVAFWSLFDPGHPEVLGCSKGAPRYVGMILWAVFQLFSSVILINLLIAMMNTTIQEIQKDKITEWKFARTEIWIQFFDRNHILPPPINLFEMLIRGTKNFFCKRKQKVDLKRGSASSCRYTTLVNELSERYLHNREDSVENDVTKEDLVNTKRELLRSMNLFVKAITPPDENN